MSATMDLTVSGSRLSIAADDMQPGDEAMRALTIDVSGTPQMQNAELVTQATVSSDLDTNTHDGLQLSIEQCSQPWDETLTSGVPTGYSCGGSTSVALAERPVIFAATALGTFDVTPGASNYFVVHLRLPESAPDDLAGLSSTIELTFRAHQRGPAAR